MSIEEFVSERSTFPFPAVDSQQFCWLAWIVKAVIVLNLLDSIFTLIWINTGPATEANVFLKNLTDHNPVVFMLVKISLVSLGLILLWRYRRHPVAVAGLLLAFATYSIILLFHFHIFVHII